MQPKTLLILAGGLGSRYRGLKQIDGITPHGESILEFSVFDALFAGFNKFVFIINRQIPADFVQRITAALQQRNAQAIWIVQDKQYGAPTGYDISERQKPWGTAQAVLCAREAIDEPFAVINADDFYGKEIYPLAIQAIAKGEINSVTYQLITFPVASTLSENGVVARGICKINSDGFLQRIEEQTSLRQENGSIFYEENGEKFILEPSYPVSMNFWLFHPSIFGYLSTLFTEFLQSKPSPSAEFYIPRAVQELIATNKIKVRVQNSPSRWMGVTYAGDKEKLVEFVSVEVKQNRYPEPLWK